jgi:hypothetical protein
MPPPSRENTGSCSIPNIESVKNVKQNVVRQAAEPVISTDFLQISWQQLIINFLLSQSIRACIMLGA